MFVKKYLTFYLQTSGIPSPSWGWSDPWSRHCKTFSGGFSPRAVSSCPDSDCRPDGHIRRFWRAAPAVPGSDRSETQMPDSPYTPFKNVCSYPPGYIVALSDRIVQLIFVLILYFGAVSCLERIHPGHLQKWGYSSLGLDKCWWDSVFLTRLHTLFSKIRWTSV